jgi:hypothetical protein
MDCLTFSTMVEDAARQPLAGSTLRKDFMDHAAVCEACRRHLAALQALSSALGMCAAGVAESAPSPFLEARLMNEFRRQARAASPPSRWKALGLAAAAALALAAPSLMYLGRRHASAIAPPNAAVRRQSQQLAASSGRLPASAGAMKKGARPAATVKQAAKARARSAKTKSQVARRRFINPVSPVIWTGNFLPLPQGENMPEAIETQVVRIELPGAALASLGMQPPLSAPNTVVTADVLIGSDGIARGIRFVQ